jgi:phosphatidylserine/phosphatidylglycerophosphate/cardiolipin synthase-like enzyme
MKELESAVVDVVRRLPAAQITTLARTLASEPEPTPAARGRLQSLFPTPEFTEAASTLVDAWQAAERLSGDALALALTATSEGVRNERTEETIEIVWTGPHTPEVPLRLTREALIDVIRAAKRSLVVVSFAAYKVELVVSELSKAAERGVDVRLVLEQAQQEGGVLTFAAAGAFKDLREKAGFYIWPLAKRPVLERGRAALHAKAAVADDHTAFVTSANLTGQAISENMELGILIRGGSTPRRLANHFAALMADGTLERSL